MTNNLVVSEIFSSIQGEGPSCGRRAVFLRLGGCQLGCVWCDSAYSWDWQGKNGVVYDPKEELKTLSFDEVSIELIRLNFRDIPLFVITGGEPLAQSTNLKTFLAHCDATRVLRLRHQIEVETSGVILPMEFGSTWKIQYNVSPKLSNSGMPREKRWRMGTLEQFVNLPETIFKFVVTCEEDLAEIIELQSSLAITPNRIWLMPEGQTREDIRSRLPQVVEWALDHQWNVTTRLQIEVWGKRRGV